MCMCVCVHVCVFFLSESVIGGIERSEEMKEKQRKEERGRDGVFNLLSTGSKGKRERMRERGGLGERESVGKGVTDKQ